MAPLVRSFTAASGLAGLAVLALTATPASAHLMPAGHGTLNVQDGKAYMVLSVPVEAFSAVEACRDGILTPLELAQNRARLVEQVQEQVTLGNAGAFEQVLFDLPSGYGHEHDAGEDLVVMVVAPVVGLSAGLELTTSLWSEEVPRLKVRGTISEQGRDVRKQVVSLTPERRSATFFGSAGPRLARTEG